MLAILVSEENANSFLEFLPKDMLSQNDVFFGVVDEDTDTACGIVAAQALSKFLLSISYIYVDEAYRRKGAGRALIDALLEFCQISSFSALMCEHRESFDKNDMLISSFLRNYGFNSLDYTRNITYSVKVGAIHIEKKKLPGKVIPLKKIPQHSFDLYSKKIKALEKKDKTGAITELENIDSYNREFSLFYQDNNDNTMGALLIKANPKGLYLNELQAIGNNVPKIIYSLLQKMDEITKQNLPPNTSIFINSTSEHIIHSIETITESTATPVWSNVVDAYFI